MVLTYIQKTDGVANSIDADQIAPSGVIWSGSTLFAHVCPNISGQFIANLYICVTDDDFADSTPPVSKKPKLSNKENKEKKKETSAKTQNKTKDRKYVF